MAMQSQKERYASARRCGERLAHLRKARKLTLKQVAEKTGFSPQQIFLVEKGEINTPIETLARIAAALGVSLDALAFGEDEAARTHQSCLDQWAQSRPAEHLQIVKEFLQWVSDGTDVVATN